MPAMYIGQKSVIFFLPNGCTGPGPAFADRSGQARVAVVIDTSTGFVGQMTGVNLDIQPTFTLRVALWADDVGAQSTYSGVLHDSTITPGAYPVGTPGTWCESNVVAGFYTAG